MEVIFLQWNLLGCLQIALSATVAFLLLSRFYKAFLTYKSLSQIPHFSALKTTLYLITWGRKGSINIETLELLNALSRLFSKSGTFLIWVGYFPLVFVYTPEVAETILTGEESLDRPPEARFLSPVAIGNTMVLASPLKEWRRRRKFLNSAFHMGIIERYLPSFNKHAAIFVDQVRQRSDPRQLIELLPYMQRCTMSIICETAMGVDIEDQKESTAEFINTFSTVLKMSLQRIAQPWLHPDIVFNCLLIGRRYQKNMDILNAMTRNIIAKKKSMMLSDPTIKRQIEENFLEGAKQMKVAFIDLLLYQHLYGDEKLSADDILGEIYTFIFAGYDTCSVTISWALYLIGNDLRVQRVIHNELDTVLGNDRDRPISAADIKNMKYLSCVFKETLRLYPPGGVVFRYTNKEMKLNRYTIPAATPVGVFIHALHRDPRYFPKPECFIPERFLNKNENWHPYAYIPFAGGPKNCIGQKFAYFEAMTVLASILSNFSVISANTRDKMRIAMDPVTTPFNPLHMYLTPRCP